MITFNKAFRDTGSVMTMHYLWFIAAAILVGVEMMTGTFYLLVLAVAAIAAGLLAFLGIDFWWQVASGALVAVVGTYLLHEWKKKNATQPKLSANLDVGQRVRVNEWRDDGTARVFYRGSQWDAILESDVTPKSEQMVIVGTRGSQLVLGALPQ
jgi:membrane protein implicated in regulation of membrane protease activity